MRFVFDLMTLFARYSILSSGIVFEPRIHGHYQFASCAGVWSTSFRLVIHSSHICCLFVLNPPPLHVYFQFLKDVSISLFNSASDQSMRKRSGSVRGALLYNNKMQHSVEPPTSVNVECCTRSAEKCMVSITISSISYAISLFPSIRCSITSIVLLCGVLLSDNDSGTLICRNTRLQPLYNVRAQPR